MGRHSCCYKQKLRKGLWSPEEDEKLFNHIITFGVGCWSSVPQQAGLQRCGKSCRLRWLNYLRPDLKRGTFSQQEEELIISLHKVLGNRWSQIAGQLPGRTDNEIKNFWNSSLKKKLRQQGIDPNTHRPLDEIEAQEEKPVLSNASCNASMDNLPRKQVFDPFPIMDLKEETNPTEGGDMNLYHHHQFPIRNYAPFDQTQLMMPGSDLEYSSIPNSGFSNYDIVVDVWNSYNNCSNGESSSNSSNKNSSASIQMNSAMESEVFDWNAEKKMDSLLHFHIDGANSEDYGSFPAMSSSQDLTNACLDLSGGGYDCELEEGFCLDS